MPIIETLGNNNMYKQGLIEPPKAVRGYAMYVDSEILDVTKNRFLD